MTKVTIPKRTKQSLNGLQKMIDYINERYTTKELTILEIGSWTGASAELFAKNFKSVICVDPFEPTAGTISTQYNMKDVENEFDKMKAKYKNIAKMRHRSQDVMHMFKNNSIDVIYIDGEHTYKAVLRDIALCQDKAKLFLCGHDYWQSKFPGVIKAVNQVFKKPTKVFPDTSWLVEK